MAQITLVESFYQARYSIFKWRLSLAVTQKLALALGMAVATGLLAQIRIPLGWTPVPITGQTLGVLLAGIMLGRNYGGISMAIYAVMGAAGLPLFTGWAGGLAVLAGPTGGYIFGFIPAALFLGYVSDKYVKSRNFVPMFLLMSIAVFGLIHLSGLIYLGIWLSAVKGTPVTIYEIFLMGSAPFIPGALIKIAAAAAMAKAITPKRPFDN
jgi:biotin transport system substrate-specific component